MVGVDGRGCDSCSVGVRLRESEVCAAASNEPLHEVLLLLSFLCRLLGWVDLQALILARCLAFLLIGRRLIGGIAYFSEGYLPGLARLGFQLCFELLDLLVLTRDVLVLGVNMLLQVVELGLELVDVLVLLEGVVSPLLVPILDCDSHPIRHLPELLDLDQQLCLLAVQVVPLALEEPYLLLQQSDHQ